MPANVFCLYYTPRVLYTCVLTDKLSLLYVPGALGQEFSYCSLNPNGGASGVIYLSFVKTNGIKLLLPPPRPSAQFN